MVVDCLWCKVLLKYTRQLAANPPPLHITFFIVFPSFLSFNLLLSLVIYTRVAPILSDFEVAILTAFQRLPILTLFEGEKIVIQSLYDVASLADLTSRGREESVFDEGQCAFIPRDANWPVAVEQDMCWRI